MKQKRLVTAIKGIIGAELVLSAAFIPMAHAQSTSTTTGAGGNDGHHRHNAPRHAPQLRRPLRQNSKKSK